MYNTRITNTRKRVKKLIEFTIFKKLFGFYFDNTSPIITHL